MPLHFGLPCAWEFSASFLLLRRKSIYEVSVFLKEKENTLVFPPLRQTSFGLHAVSFWAEPIFLAATHRSSLIYRNGLWPITPTRSSPAAKLFYIY